MSDGTAIEWCDASQNVTVGCVSAIEACAGDLEQRILGITIEPEQPK